MLIVWDEWELKIELNYIVEDKWEDSELIESPFQNWFFTF